LKTDRPGFPIFKIRIKYEPDIVTARQKTRRVSQLLGFGGQDRARLSTAVSELARNVFQYAGGGSIEFFFKDADPQTLFVRVSDDGPGIKDLETILNGTYISQSGMGVGLSGSKKLMDFFDIQTTIGKGTQITLGKSLDKRQKQIRKEDLPEIASKLISTVADSAFEEIQNQNRDLLEALEDARLARHELTALNSKLKMAYEDAANANQAKSRFLSNMSHEIRTPLGIVLGFADLAMDSETSFMERNSYLTIIKKNAQSLTNLIGDFLDLSKVEAGKIELECLEFSLPEVLQDAVAALSLNAKNKGVLINLVIEGLFPNIVCSDPTRVRQVLFNLINNAIKFTERGDVEIKALAIRNPTNPKEVKIEISVRDSGIGIPLENQDRLFEAFTQADSSTTRKYGGTGLGLNLSKHLAEALGGNLFLLSSRENIGSTFCFNFPVLIVQKTEFKLNHSPKNEFIDLIEIPQQNDELQGMPILLVEDSEDNRFLFQHYLSRAGASIDIAHDGLQGVQKAKMNSYKAILMDIQMPHLDGYGATKQIRELGIRTPVIALTAHALKDERENALNSGFNGYLIKPLNPRLLIETLALYK
jgi:signal transduction histidine kinase/CheY-like chemotaxis protein